MINPPARGALFKFGRIGANHATFPDEVYFTIYVNGTVAVVVAVDTKTPARVVD